MDPNDRDKLNKLEQLKSRLFNRSYKVDVSHRDPFSHLENKDVPEGWKQEPHMNIGEKFFMKTSLFKKFFIFSVGFFALAILYAGYSFFIGGNTVSNDNIDIAIVGNTFTAGGEELDLQVEITNKNNAPLELVDLIMDYPKSSTASGPGDFEHFRESLGTIPAGKVRKENLKLVLFGEQGSSRQIRISIEYRVAGSNAIFVKEKVYEVSISSTPINLSLDAPSEISPNQDVVLQAKVSLNSTKPANKILFKVDYPPGFKFDSANPAPSFGNNVWNLGDIAPGVERSIKIVGKMIDVSDGEEKTFHMTTGSQSDTDKTNVGVIFTSLNHTIKIKKPFIEAQLLINGVYQRDYAIDSKSIIRGDINWKNNLDTKINDLEITAKVTGNAWNRKNVSVSQGRFRSTDDTIIWDKTTLSEFAEVNSGESGSVSFSLSPLSLFSGSEDILSQPTVNIEISVSAKQPVEGNALQTIDNGETKTIKLITDVGFAAKALYFSGAFKNSGPIPPRAEKETTYTVVWTLSNTANNISKAIVTSSLPPWMKFLGPVSPASEDIKYNASTKEILWNVGTLPRGGGITVPGREVSFQVVLIPSLSQVGTTPVIINDAVLTGHDDFANVNIRVNKASLDTRLSNDSAFPPSGDRVIE